MNEIKTGFYNYNGEDVEFNFNVSPSYAKQSEFVNAVVDSLIGDTYNYILKDLIFDYMIISVFTDVDVSYIKKCNSSSQTIDLIEELLMNSNIVDIVKNNLGVKLVSKLEDAVNKSIEYKTGIHCNPISDAIANLINTLDEKANNFNLDSDEMLEVANALINMKDEFTADKIIEAYARSEFKKNNKS